MLQKFSEQIGECLRRAADAGSCAEATNDVKLKAEYQRIADTWRSMARSYEFQESLQYFISFNLPAAQRQTKTDFLDWLARFSENIRPYSAAAFGIAFASVALATLILFIEQRISSTHVSHFAIYIPAILAAGLLAGMPAALGVGLAAIIIIAWAFMPPYFEFKWPSEIQHINVFFNTVPYLITVYFAYLCHGVLQRLRRGELNNRILARELEHRGRNLFSIIEVIVQKTLIDNPEGANSIIGRLKSLQYSNELLIDKPRSVSINDLLQQEFAAYGAHRLHMRGPAFDIAPDSARHLILVFHELATNAAKYGSLSCPNGQVFVEWQSDSNNIVLTWKERGGPIVTPPTERHFGSQLIDISIRELSGTKQEEFAPEGFVCKLIFKIAKNNNISER